MNGKCPFCNQVFNAGNKTNTNIYRHIRKMAVKPLGKRGNHPSKDSKAYEELAARLRFRKVGKAAKEKKKMASARDKLAPTESRSVGDLMEVKREEEMSSLQSSSEVRERIAKAIQKLRCAAFVNRQRLSMLDQILTTPRLYQGR